NLIVNGAQNHGTAAGMVIKGGGVILNSNAGAPASAGSASVTPLAIEVSGDGALLKLGADQDLSSLSWINNPGLQTIDLASPSDGFRSMRIYAADLAAAKKSLYLAISNALVSNSADGIIDSRLSAHPGAKIGIAQVSDAHGDPYILIRASVVGDLNLDGRVSIADFIA